MTRNDDKYTDAELRSQIKEEVQAGDKGGKPGQWSARKAQMMASEYKKQMHERGEEPYTTDKSEQSESQKHLNDWTKEEWQTSDGNGTAKQEDGTEKRYLPKKVWENMTEEEKEEANEQKLKGSAHGEQYVPNTDAAKKAREDAQESEAVDVADKQDAEGNKQEKTNGKTRNSKDDTEKCGTKHKRNSEGDEHVEGDSDGKNTADDKEVDDTAESLPPAKQAKGEDGGRRTTQSHLKGESSKTGEEKGKEEDKDKKNDKETNRESKGDEEHGQQASATRLPKEGQKVFWRASPGWVEGSVVEVAYSEKEVDGKQVKASENDPRIVLKSAKSGKTAVHKPEAVYF